MSKRSKALNIIIDIFLIYFGTVVCASDFALKHDVENHFWDESVECVNYLINNVKCGAHITIVVPHTDVNFIPTNSCATFAVRSYNRNDWYIKTDVYIIYRNNLDSSLWYITFDEMWNPRAKFIVVISKEIERHELNRIFDEFLLYNILDVVVLANVNNSQVIFTYYPLRNGNCGNKYEKIVELPSCFHIEKPLTMDYKDCSVKVIVNKNLFGTESYIKRLDRYILKSIAKSNNIQLRYQYPKIEFGVVLPNYTSTGMLQLLQNKKADVMIGGFLLDDSCRAILDFMLAHNYVSVKLLLPCSKQHVWKIIFHTFKSISWLIILISYIVMVLVSSAKSHYLKIKTYQINTRLLDNFFGHSIVLFRVKQFRVLLILWVWYTFLITNFYQSSLYSLLTTVTHRTKMDMQNLTILERKYKPCLTKSIQRDYKTAYNITLSNKNGQSCHDAESSLRTMMTSDEYYSLVTEYDFYRYKLNDSDGEDKNIHPWSYSPHFVYVIYTARGFYLRDQFQKRITRIFEAGLLRHHFRVNFSNNTIQPITIHAATERFYRVLNLDDLRIPFIILFVGYIITFLVFAVEYMKLKN